MKYKKKKQSKIMLIPVLFIVCVLPFVMRMDIVETGLSDLPFLPSSMGQRADFFLLWKSRLFTGTAAIMLFLLIDYFLVKRQRDTHWKTWIPLMVYEFLVVFSAILSPYQMYSFEGMMEHYETVWVLLGYGIIAYYTYIFVETKEDVRLVTGAMLVGALVQGIIGLLQVFNYNVIDTPFIKALMIPEKYESLADSIVFNFSGEAYRKVSTTLYNPNYAGIYFAIMFFIAVAWIIDGSLKKKIAFGILALLLAVCLLGTGSRAAIIIFGMMLVVGLFLFARADKRKWKAAFFMLGAAAVLVVAYDAISGTHTLQRLKEGFASEEKEYALTDIQVKDDHIQICYKDKMLTYGWEKNGEALFPIITDENGNALTLLSNEDDQFVTIDDPYYDGLVFFCYRKDGIPYLVMKYYDRKWMFTDYTEDGKLAYINMWGKLDKIEKAESALFTGKEELFTYRGYIWGRTIPLLKDYIFFGSGPDTFLLVFPQNDYVMRSNMGFGFFSEILTKPHSMYLQMAVQTGVLSVVAFFVFVGIYIADYIKSIRSREKNGDGIATAIFLAVVSYLIFAVANDSMIVTAPIFFVLLGLGKKLSRN